MTVDVDGRRAGPAAVTGMSRLLALASSRTRLRSASAATTIGPVDVEIDRVVARRPSTLSICMKKRDWSPTERKRGSVPASTTGSRTITSALALPTRSFVQATAITRAVPLKAGMSKSTSAVPSGADLDHAGIARERLLGRRDALDQRRPHVAAGADGAAGALHAVDEVAVEVADLGRELPLAEEILDRIGR